MSNVTKAQQGIIEAAAAVGATGEVKGKALHLNIAGIVSRADRTWDATFTASRDEGELKVAMTFVEPATGTRYDYDPMTSEYAAGTIEHRARRLNLRAADRKRLEAILEAIYPTEVSEEVASEQAE